MGSSCPFCARLKREQLLAKNDLAVALADAFPLNPGHAIIVPHRHEKDYFALSEAEQQAMWGLVARVCHIIEESHKPEGFNIGLNAGEAAGQTIAHAHLHVIPRYEGDVDDPRGGIRWILPERAPYWRD